MTAIWWKYRLIGLASVSDEITNAQIFAKWSVLVRCLMGCHGQSAGGLCGYYKIIIIIVVVVLIVAASISHNVTATD